MATLANTPRSTTITPVAGEVGPFLIGFRLFQDDAIRVYQGGVPVDVTVTATFNDGYTDTATFTLDAPASGETLRVDGDMAPYRPDDYVPTDPRLVQNLNIEMGRIWAVLQELHRDTGRSLRTSTAINPFSILPGHLVIATHDGFAQGPDATDIASAQSYAARAEAAAAMLDANVVKFNDLSALRAYTQPLLASNVVVTLAEGYAYRVTPTDPDLTTAGGAGLIALPSGGAYDARAFGAVGNGVADDTAAFQRAANVAGNGTVRVPPGDYMIHEVLNTQGTMFDCTLANGETSANANGTAAGKVRFRYNGAGGPGGFMFRWRAATANQWLFGGGIKGRPVLNGMTTCAYAILADSTSFQDFFVEMRNFTSGGVRLSSDNGVLSVSCNVNAKFTYGSVPAVEGAHGVILIGETNNAGCTQHDIKTHGLIKHGDMVRMVGNCDNNRLTVHASKGGSSSGATGNAIAFYDGATVHPRNNTIYDVAGPVYSSINSFGNWLLRSSSEGTKIHGSGQLHYSMVDYVNGKRYATPAFPMFERREMAGTTGFLIGGATAGTVTGVGAGVICAAGANSGALWTIGGGNWTRGKLRRFRVKYSCANASASNNTRFRLSVSIAPMGAGLAADYTVTMTASGTAAGMLAVHEFVILDASNLDMIEDALVSFSIERMGTDALDTVTGAVRIHAVEVDFVAFGPNNTYTAPVAYPDFRRSNAV